MFNISNNFKAITLILIVNILLAFNIFISMRVLAENVVPKVETRVNLPVKGSFEDIEIEQFSEADRAELLRSGCTLVVDMFESWPESQKWDVSRMVPMDRFKLQQAQKRQGRKALAIHLAASDATNSNGKQKHELWVAKQRRCMFGDETWYSFSFRIDGDYPLTGSTRWVIGQWKEETNGSPFLAQRFDNGVFHISIQRGDRRQIIATAPGDFDALSRFLFSSVKSQLLGHDGTLARDEVVSGIEENLSETVDMKAFKKAIDEQEKSAFPYVADPYSLHPLKGVNVEMSDHPFLPDPSRGWVDMRYRIKGGRDGDGLIEIWANDKFIVRVTGKIGNDVFGGPTQYFKFGHYKDVDSRFKRSTIFLDRYRRGTQRRDVD